MKVNISDKAKINLKAVTFTTLAVLVILFILTMLVKHTAAFMAILIVIIFLCIVGYFIFQMFSGIRNMIIQHQEEKESKERRRAKGY